MRSLLLLMVAVMLATPLSSDCCTVTLGDGESLSGAEVAQTVYVYGSLLGLGSEWTLCIAPGTYLLDPSDGWPVVLTEFCPEIVGPSGAEATVLIGDGSMSAFVLHGGLPFRLSGLTFSSFGEAVDRESPEMTTVRVTDCVIEYCGAGLDAQNASGGEVMRNVIRYNSGCGLYVYHNSTHIEDNEIYGNGSGIASPCCETPLVRGNHIHDNDSYGMSNAFGGHLEFNLIEDNGGAGVAAYGVGPRIEHNVIRGNSVGISIGEQTSITINLNDLYDNDTYEVAVVSASSGGVVDATMNWWGTTDPVMIGSRIHDRLDDPSLLTLVAFDPWCEQPGCDGGTVVEHSTWGNIKALYRK